MEKYMCIKECGNTEPSNCELNICLNCGSGILLVPRKGSIAICSRGFLGLITDDDKKDITYSDGNIGKAYVGVHLCSDQKFFGIRWSSTKPKVIGHIDDFIGTSLIEKEIDEVEEMLNDKKRRLDVAEFISPDERESIITTNTLTELMETLNSLKSLLNEKKDVLCEIKKYLKS